MSSEPLLKSQYRCLPQARTAIGSCQEGPRSGILVGRQRVYPSADSGRGNLPRWLGTIAHTAKDREIYNSADALPRRVCRQALLQIRHRRQPDLPEPADCTYLTKRTILNLRTTQHGIAEPVLGTRLLAPPNQPPLPRKLIQTATLANTLQKYGTPCHDSGEHRRLITQITRACETPIPRGRSRRRRRGESSGSDTDDDLVYPGSPSGNGRRGRRDVNLDSDTDDDLRDYLDYPGPPN